MEGIEAPDWDTVKSVPQVGQLGSPDSTALQLAHFMASTRR
jgi:hypothetical protein